MPIYIETGSYFTVAEAAETLGLRKNYVYQLLQDGRMAGFRVGRLSWLIPSHVVAEQKQKPPVIGRPKSN